MFQQFERNLENEVYKLDNVVGNFKDNVVGNIKDNVGNFKDNVGNLGGKIVGGIGQRVYEKSKETKSKIEIVTPLTVQKVMKNIGNEKMDGVSLLMPFSLDKDSFSAEEYCRVYFDKRRRRDSGHGQNIGIGNGPLMNRFGLKRNHDSNGDEDDKKNEDNEGNNNIFNKLKNLRKKNRAATDVRSNVPREGLKDSFEEHKEVLKNYKMVLSEVLIRDVNNNYPLFLQFSKEIAHVEQELIELGKLWNEMKHSLQVVSEINANRDEFKYVGSFKSDLNNEGIEYNETKKTIEFFKDILIDFRSAVESRDWNESLEQFEKATYHLETYKLKQSNPGLVKDFIYERENFSNVLLKELENPVNSYSTVEFLITTLKKLNLKEKACSIYLKVKSDKIQQNIKKINSTGNILVFANYFSGIFFTNIRKFSLEFTKLFDDEQTSEFLKWAIQEVQLFCEEIRDKVFSMCSNEFKTVARALNIVFSYAKKLSENGISINFVLLDAFRKDLESAMEKFKIQAQAKLFQNISSENWNGGMVELKSRSNETITVFITETAKEFFNILMEFIDILDSIASTMIYQKAMTDILEIVQNYLLELHNVSTTISMNDKQFFSLITNSSFINKTLIPILQKELKDVFDRRELPELNKFSKTTAGIDKKLLTIYCNARAEIIISKLQFHQQGYPGPPTSTDDLKVSRTFASFIVFLANLSKDLVNYDKLRYKEIIIPTILDKVVENIISYEAGGEFIQRVESLQTEDPEYVAPLEIVASLLDLKFLLYCCSDFVEASTKKNLIDFMKTYIIKVYEDCVEELTYDEAFYNSKIQDSIEKSVSLKEAISILKKK